MTRVHMLCDANGITLKFLLSGGQASDIAYAQPLLDEAYIPDLRGRPRKRCRWLLADKGYDAEALRRDCDRYLPLRSMRRKPRSGLPRLFDRPKYRQRNIITSCPGLVDHYTLQAFAGRLAKDDWLGGALGWLTAQIKKYF